MNPQMRNPNNTFSTQEWAVAKAYQHGEDRYIPDSDPPESIDWSDDDDDDDDENDSHRPFGDINNNAFACKLRVTLPANHQNIEQHDYFYLAMKCITAVVHKQRDGLTWGYETFNKEGQPCLTHLHIHWIGWTKWEHRLVKTARNRLGIEIKRILQEIYPDGLWTHSGDREMTKSAFGMESVKSDDRFLFYPLKQKHAYSLAYVNEMEIPFDNVMHRIDLAHAEWTALANSKSHAKRLKDNKKSLADKIIAHFEKTNFKPSTKYQLADAVDDYMVENGFNVLPENVVKTTFLVGRRLKIFDNAKIKLKIKQMLDEMI